MDRDRPVIRVLIRNGYLSGREHDAEEDSTGATLVNAGEWTGAYYGRHEYVEVEE